MNKERMLKLADEIEKPMLNLGVQFNMTDFYRNRSCGTTCCIGGIACLMFGAEGGHAIDYVNAKELLDLSEMQAEALFFNYDHYVADIDTPFPDITRKQAALAIRKMVREEGE